MPIHITPLTDPRPTASGRRLAWLATADTGVPVGSAFLRLFTRAGQDHLAELDVQVHPAERRNGVGSRLLAAALAAAEEEGRRCVTGQAEAGSPGDAFGAARGFRPVLRLTYARLPLAQADLTGLAERAAAPHPGYRLLSWDGTVPDEWAATFAASRRAMDDMPVTPPLPEGSGFSLSSAEVGDGQALPVSNAETISGKRFPRRVNPAVPSLDSMDDVDYGTVTWDVERVRVAALAVESRGDLLHTVAAVDESDGSIAGFTELVVPGDGAGDGRHYGTGVLSEHRGHGLARWMKATMILRAAARHPDLAGLVTDTADSNHHMRAVNDALGYLPTHQTVMRQFDLPG